LQPDNAEIASCLRRVAELLEVQGANPFRVRAYRFAADEVEACEDSLAGIARSGGRKALEELPGVGTSIATQIEQMARTGQMGILRRLEGEVPAEDRFVTLPGVGPALARRIHEELGVETLEELELAAHDGRLGSLEGFGARRVQGIRDALAGILSRSAGRGLHHRMTAARQREDAGERRPSVSTLLEVDFEYRRRAAAGELPRIAPRRFNPGSEAWLPVLHLERDGWSFSALFSNTARAHELGRTRDWVVIYYERDGHEGQCTVVTETRGPRVGRRVVRGRESGSHGGRSRAASPTP